jgi:cytochrome b6-f complex iron-sulfur subunit
MHVAKVNVMFLLDKMMSSRSLMVSVAANMFLVGVLMYSVTFAGSQTNLGSAMRTRNTFQARVNRALVQHNSRNLAVRAGTPGMVPDMGKRNTMNAILLGSVGATVGSAALPYLYFFFPQLGGGGGGSIPALDSLGNAITTESWFKDHKKNARDLVQGIKGDPTYLIVTEDGNSLNSYGLNAVCTHLGCVVPWDGQDMKFKCPCHGSQYAADGHVVRGPAPRPLALAHVIDNGGKVELSPWTETDFRTGEKPWWA